LVTEKIADLLKKARTIAVVGLSDKPDRPSYHIASYLLSVGYRVIPINPRLKTIFNEKVYPDLQSVPDDIALDIVDIFRRSEDVLPIVEQAIPKKPSCIWMQLGIINPDAAKKAESAGITVVMNRCISVVHQQLFGFNKTG
jgi:predicted CoA-binding protein